MTRNTPSASLQGALAEFLRHPTPWMLTIWSAALLTARIMVGHWTIADLSIPVILVAVSPLAEWMIHVGILHWRPRPVGPVMIDSRLARDHRQHHHDPRDVSLVFIPWQSLVLIMIALSGASLIRYPQVGPGLTLASTVALFLLFYEWTHYLIHTDYKPRHRVYRAVWRNHRYHHFKNEHYWFTVTSSGTADRLLGTCPDPAQVPSSPTVRNLHAPSRTG